MSNSSKIREFKNTYTKAIVQSNAAIFAGAGLSQPAGYVNWKFLLKEVAEDLELDIDLEEDLISLAQYHVNEFDGRSKINQILIDEFTKDVKPTENHQLLSELPIKTYWTTNYDNLIESNLTVYGKKVDIKIDPENFSHSRSDLDATVYKMHGDSTSPHSAVLTKSDYEEYDSKREIFSTALRGDLVSKTFLFIGFSFDDPNLSYILSRIRMLLGTNARNHYCFMRKVSRDDYKTEKEFNYAEIKQELKIKDLKRYKIVVLLVDEYSEITSILQEIKNSIKRKNIFISGSAAVFKEDNEFEAFDFSTQLSKNIIRNKKNIISGFGVGIGSCVISGALEELYQSGETKVEERLKSRPFPQNSVGKIPLKNLWTDYRKDMLSSVGAAIFIFGNKLDPKTGDIIPADGMREEFQIALEKGIIPIPIGATGFTSKELWIEVMDNFDEYVGIEQLKSLYEVIGDEEKTFKEIIEATLEIINIIK